MKETVNIRIMENDFQLACEPSERANIESSARYLNDQLRQFRADNPEIPYEKLLIMGALRVTVELLTSNREMSEEIRATNNQLAQLIRQITPAEA